MHEATIVIHDKVNLHFTATCPYCDCIIEIKTSEDYMSFQYCCQCCDAWYDISAAID